MSGTRSAGERLETLAIHAAGRSDDATGAVTLPIHLSTTFERSPEGSYPHGYVYTRSGNPNRDALERTLAALDGGAAAAAFSSGSAAASVALRSLLRPGDEALVPDDMYHGIRRLLLEALQPWGVRITRVDMSDPVAVANALTSETRILWIETPSNPLLKITDVSTIADLAHRAGARVICDATWTPARMLPAFELGADIVLHATTKYLSGHSDVLGGALVVREVDAAFEQIRFLQGYEGAVPSPFDCWLTLRGIKTLPYRLRGHLANAEKVAAFLHTHPSVAKVYYPGLPEHPGFDVAQRQMSGFGGMLSFRLRGGEEAAVAVAAKVTLIRRATSLGGVESLIEHRASIEGADTLTPRDLLRLSVGLEHFDDIIWDLDQALGSA
ncbi:MAG: aminotransferase class I/II-fold pyridoxal phosphate-dependent enzyme [Trueperaceae bacterium]